MSGTKAGKVVIVEPRFGRALQALGDRIVCKATSSETRGAWELFEIEAAPGGGPPLHRHPWDEAYFVLEGELEFQVAGKKSMLRPGAFVSVPGGTPHTLFNHGPAPCRYLLWGSPAATGAFFADLDEMGRTGTPTLERILAIAGKHGIEALAGPA